MALPPSSAAVLLNLPSTRRRIAASLLFLLVLGTGYSVFLLTLPSPDSWVTLTAKTESLAFKVLNPDMATVRITGMRAVAVEGTLNACVDAIATPRAGARIEYRRGGSDFFRITLDPPSGGGGAVTLRDRTKGSVLTPSGSVIFTATNDCPGEAPTRLPLWGVARFGEDLRPADAAGVLTPGVMTEGTIAVFARAQEQLLGVHFPASIYPVTTFDLPAGSVIDSATSDLWTGVVLIDDDTNGLQVEATSRARQLYLASARSFGPQTSPRQEIDLGQYAQFLKDPNVIEVQFLGGMFLFVVQSTLSIIAFLLRMFAPQT